MQYSADQHVELTPQHYVNLIATGFRYMEFLGYLEAEEQVGMILALYRPVRLKGEGQDFISIEDPLVKNLVYTNESIAIFIERNY